MKTVAYLRISTGSQDLANQKLAVLDYARQKRFTVDRFVEAQVSSRKDPAQRGIDDLLGALAAGDRLIVSELSRLGRSLGQVIQLVDELVKRKVRFVAIKEAIRFEGKQDLQTKVMIALFGLFAEVERDLISQRTKEGLAAARAKGRLLGRPKGSLGKSKLDGKEEEIRMLLEKRSPRRRSPRSWASPATALHHFIRTRKLDPKASKGETGGAVLRAYFRRNLGGSLESADGPREDRRGRGEELSRALSWVGHDVRWIGRFEWGSHPGVALRAGPLQAFVRFGSFWAGCAPPHP